MTLEELQSVVLGLSMPKFTAAQIARWLYVGRVTSIEEMTNLSKKAREVLKENYSVGREKPIFSAESVDGTKKYLFETGKGRAIESVYIPDKDRATLCISSQVGCRMNCRFCMTGRQGFHGNLSATEILNQILSIPESENLTNIVYMGMGEPMDNIDSVLKSIEVMTAPWGLAWSPRRITVSSIGKLDNLKRLLEETQVHVAISVHSPFEKERASLMPVEHAYPITKVVNLLSQFDFKHQRRCSVEYIMWNNFNDDLQHARKLAELIRKIPGVRINLIRYHSVPEVPDLTTSPEEKMIAFRDFLNEKGFLATIRTSRGEDIMAACGQLSGNFNDINHSS